MQTLSIPGLKTMRRRRTERVTLNLEVSPELKERLIYQARLNYRTATAEARRILDQHLMQLPKPEPRSGKKKKDQEEG